MLSRFKSSRNSSIILKAIQILPRTDRPKIMAIALLDRLSTVRNCDKVIYMANGEIISQGTFNQVRDNVPDFAKQAHLMGL